MRYIILILLLIPTLLSFVSVTFFFGLGLPLGGFFLCLVILYYFTKIQPHFLNRYFRITIIVIALICLLVSVFLFSDYIKKDYPNSGVRTLLDPPTNFEECIEASGTYLENKGIKPEIRCEFRDKLFYR